MAMAVASLSHHLLYVFVLAIFFLSHPVYSEKECKILKGLNRFRTMAKRQEFKENDNARCVAERIAHEIELENEKCTDTNYIPGKNRTSLNDFPKAISKCDIAFNTTLDAVVLPACVPDLEPARLLTNYTRTNYSKYINDSSYTGIGFGYQVDWMVVVLTSKNPNGTLADGAPSLRDGMFGLSYYTVFLLLGYLHSKIVELWL